MLTLNLFAIGYVVGTDYKSKFCFRCKVLKELDNFRMPGRKMSNYCNECQEIHCIEQKEKLKDRMKKYRKKVTQRAPDHYIKSLISANTCSRDDVPQELIDAKRIQLQIKRFLKEKQNEKHQ